MAELKAKKLADNLEFSISEINNIVKRKVDNLYQSAIKIKGELFGISNSHGNYYLKVRDKESSITVVIWKDSRIDYEEIKEGAHLIITGRLVVFQKTGSYVFNAFKIEADGTGKLHEKFLKIRAKFEERGYFDPAKKKKLPVIVTKIGIVTSRNGAALQDILKVLRDNHYFGKVLVRDSLVQGENCHVSLSSAIKFFDSLTDKVDVVIISRGGGSSTDLSGFSHPMVVNAIHESSICTIAAIGHEVDQTLADLTADYCVPTPSIAGKLITDHQRLITDKLNESYLTELKGLLYQKINELTQQLDDEFKRVIHPSQYLDELKTQIEQSFGSVKQLILEKIMRLQQRVSVLDGRLTEINPSALLSKGYTIILDQENRIIKNVDYFRHNLNNTRAKLILSNGTVNITFTNAQIVH